MTCRVERIEIRDLFGYVSHSFDCEQSAATILTAPNGAGKTHLMRMVTELLQFNLPTLLEEPFSDIDLTLSGGVSMRARNSNSEQSGKELTVTLKDSTNPIQPTIELHFNQESLALYDSFAESLPPRMRNISFLNIESQYGGRSLSVRTLESRYGEEYGQIIELMRVALEARKRFDLPDGVFIDTKRLYESPFDGNSENSSAFRSASVHSRGAVRASAKISSYISRIRRQLAQARRESVENSQRSDMNIASRLMAASKATINEPKLRSRYVSAVELQQRLAKNSLAIAEELVPLPSKMNPTQRRILSVVLDDWEKRLEPLELLNRKLETLRDILDRKLSPSGKSTILSPDGELQFRDGRGRKIGVAALSSGEQHLVALYTSLLFATPEGSVVCIDEPELSLHAAWQHAFVDEISEVSQLTDIQILLATHSTAIINGRWDITRALELQVLAYPEEETTEEEPSPGATDEEGEDDEYAF